jgi:hypothetical protein
MVEDVKLKAFRPLIGLTNEAKNEAKKTGQEQNTLLQHFSSHTAI